MHNVRQAGGSDRMPEERGAALIQSRFTGSIEFGEGHRRYDEFEDGLHVRGYDLIAGQDIESVPDGATSVVYNSRGQISFVTGSGESGPKVAQGEGLKHSIGDYDGCLRVTIDLIKQKVPDWFLTEVMPALIRALQEGQSARSLEFEIKPLNSAVAGKSPTDLPRGETQRADVKRREAFADTVAKYCTDELIRAIDASGIQMVSLTPKDKSPLVSLNHIEPVVLVSENKYVLKFEGIDPMGGIGGGRH